MIVGDVNMGIVEKYNGLVAEHKVQVPTHTLIFAQLYPTSRKGTLLQACEREYSNLIVQIRQSAPLFPMYNLQCPTKPH